MPQVPHMRSSTLRCSQANVYIGGRRLTRSIGTRFVVYYKEAHKGIHTLTCCASQKMTRSFGLKCRENYSRLERYSTFVCRLPAFCRLARLAADAAARESSIRKRATSRDARASWLLLAPQCSCDVELVNQRVSPLHACGRNKNPYSILRVDLNEECFSFRFIIFPEIRYFFNKTRNTEISDI